MEKDNTYCQKLLNPYEMMHNMHKTTLFFSIVMSVLFIFWINEYVLYKMVNTHCIHVLENHFVPIKYTIIILIPSVCLES